MASLKGETERGSSTAVWIGNKPVVYRTTNEVIPKAMER